MTERWIVGVDGSDAGVTALRWAIDHARTHDANVTVVSAYHVPAIMALFVAKRGFGVDEIGLAATAGHDADVAIAEVGAEVGAAAERPVDVQVVEGQPGPVLVEAAAGADLLVVGQRGSGQTEHRLGSVSRYCATHGGTPVVVVPGNWVTGSAERVVVGFDGSENADSALRWALGFAPDASPVTVVAAVEVAPWLGERLTRERFPEEVAEQERMITDAVNAVDVNGRTQRLLVLDAPRGALAQAASNAELMVVGARGRGLVASELLGSVSTWLLQDTTVPVAVVPHTGRR